MKTPGWLHIEVDAAGVAMWLAIGAFLYGVTSCSTREIEAKAHVQCQPQNQTKQ